MSVDYSVYLVTDFDLARGRTTRDIVAAAIRGGVSCVQLREKKRGTREFIEEALSIRELLARHGIPLIINDRLDVALAVKADGVHLGQKDMPCLMARQLAPKDMIVGISAESLEDAIQAEKDGADYVGVSPVFATPTKTDAAEPLGLDNLRRIRERVRLPLVAIGGVNAGNAATVIHHGADGVAVVSAIVRAPDPAAATRNLLDIVTQAKTGK
ncbi:MAG: thiamine phosphate synthase [Proteobacteria bacterium]|nr:thiamine phosphate synthase [Pseudomonadota bacterium]